VRELVVLLQQGVAKAVGSSWREIFNAARHWDVIRKTNTYCWFFDELGRVGIGTTATGICITARCQRAGQRVVPATRPITPSLT
jgi:hypothetical protein